MSEKSVFVVGSINRDFMVSTPVYPRLGETVHGHRLTTSAGGKGANQAVACARLGAETRMVGRVGADEHGRAMLEAMRTAGVDTGSVLISDSAQTGMAIVTHTDGGSNAIVVLRGANGDLLPDDLDAPLRIITQGDILVTQLEVPTETVRRALQVGQQRGATTILNAAPAKSVDGLLPYVDILIVNEFEAGVVAGLEKLNQDQARAAAVQIADKHDLSVILTLGERGAMVVNGAEQRDIRPFPVESVDSTGAGDTYVGALAAFLALGHTLETACEWASAAGAHACLRVGAQESAPTQQNLADRFGVGPARKADQ